MESTLNDLYLKYVNSVGPALEDDRYFQYMFESVRAGENVIEQKNQVLRKVIDEGWLDVIEDTLDSIYKIIDHPRRFIETETEVVPVDLAKKITAASVRHLSQNTQFIVSNEEGDIHPTKILNVTTKDSYDLYENRFIYHLILRLLTFIDKRTDVIFWKTMDEKRNVLNFKSKVDDAYEQIEYNLEIRVTNRQSFVENDHDNMDVFMRIDRVRRLVVALKQSPFCRLLQGCTKVRSPIQRTNLIMKDPDYRKCYQLWQFIERYDEVGYKIVEDDTVVSFDEEYLFQLYTSFVTNYTLFKSLTDPDNRDLTKLLNEHRRTRTPKFVKTIKEEIVDNPNIEEVEIRRVFVEEVTEAQVAAEKALEELKNEQTTWEGKFKKLEDKANNAKNEVRLAKLEVEEAQAEAKKAYGERDNAIKLREQAEEDQAKAVRDAAKRIEEADIRRLNAEAERKAADDKKELAELAMVEAQKKAERVEEEANQKVDKALETIAEAEERIAEADKVKKESKESVVSLKSDYEARISTMTKENTEKVNSLNVLIENAEKDKLAELNKCKESFEAKIDEINKANIDNVASIKKDAKKELATLKERLEAEIARAKDEGKATLDEAIKKHQDELSDVAKAHEDEILAIRNEVQSTIDEANSKKKEAEDTIISCKKDKEDAISKAKALTEKAKEEAALSKKAKELSKKEMDAALNIKEEADNILEEARKMREEAENMVSEIRKETEEAILAAKKERDTLVEAANKEKTALVNAALKERDNAIKMKERYSTRLEKEKALRIKAQEKAKEGTLSKYIVDRITGKNKNEE